MGIFIVFGSLCVIIGVLAVFFFGVLTGGVIVKWEQVKEKEEMENFRRNLNSNFIVLEDDDFDNA
jgi:hypothetical protein